MGDWDEARSMGMTSGQWLRVVAVFVVAATTTCGGDDVGDTSTGASTSTTTGSSSEETFVPTGGTMDACMTTADCPAGQRCVRVCPAGVELSLNCARNVCRDECASEVFETNPDAYCTDDASCCTGVCGSSLCEHGDTTGESTSG